MIQSDPIPVLARADVPFARFVTAQRRRPWRLYGALVISAVLEGLAVLFLLIQALLSVPELEPPHLSVLFMKQAALPSPPSGPPATQAARKPTPRTPRTPVLTQPRPQTQEAVKPQEEEAGGPPCTDCTNGPGTGTGPGVEGAPPGPPDPPPPPPPPQKIVLRPAVLVRREQLSGAEPHLPRHIAAMLAGSSAQGSYKLCIERGGSVQDVTVITGVPGADDEILATLRTWRFRPQAIPVCFIQNFVWQVER